MRVGLDLLYLVPGETGGTETYARRLVPELAAARPGIRLVAFARAELAAELDAEPWCDGLEVLRIPTPRAGRPGQVAAEQALLPAAARRARVDILHGLANTVPAVVPGAASVVTIHDLIHRRFPETHAGILGRGLRALVALAARRADRIVTLSEAGRRDIVELLGVDPARIDVVPNGPGADPEAAPAEADALRERLALGPGPIVLSVSAKRPHKNLGRLIDALARLDRDPPPELVIPGYRTAHEAELAGRARAAGVRERVHLPGWLAGAELEGLYRHATCLAFPSLAEGFGLPVLEAMRRGLPVACSRTSAVPEVGGDAALYFDPESVEDIAGALRRLLSDEGLRADLARRGRERARRFSWRASAEGTLGSYERALAGRRSRKG